MRTLADFICQNQDNDDSAYDSETYVTKNRVGASVSHVNCSIELATLHRLVQVPLIIQQRTAADIMLSVKAHMCFPTMNRNKNVST